MAVKKFQITEHHWDGTNTWEPGDWIQAEESVVRGKKGKLPTGWKDLGTYTAGETLITKHKHN